MNRGIYVLIVSTLLIVGATYTANAGIVLDDPLDGSTLGNPSGIEWGPGRIGQAAVFHKDSLDHIIYGNTLFPETGTISFYIKAAFDGQDAILDTIGVSAGATAGDFQIGIRPDSTVRFNILANGQWNRLKGTTPLSPNTWTKVAVSFGPTNGMKLYINAVSEGAFEAGANYFGALKDTNVYAGDYEFDSKAYAFTGSLDMLQVSNIESDPSLLHVPEPGSLAALLGGLLSTAAVIRRKSA